jgi:mono/diheme cytochrome c family protein
VKLNASQERGRELFGQICQQCHTLAASDAVGKVGPNLDKLKPPKSLVLDAVLHGRVRGAGTMPAGLYTGKDANDVAAYVGAVAGRQ